MSKKDIKRNGPVNRLGLNRKQKSKTKKNQKRELGRRG